jgi:methylglyoxal reductase
MATLPTRILGRTGIRVPLIGVGCWPIGGPDTNLGLPMGWSTACDAESRAGLRAAYAHGVRLFDTADVYGHGHSERLLGELVDEVPRETLVLTSKVGYFAGTAEHGYQPGHMRRQLEQSLENLSTDYLDIYFLHHADFGPADRWFDAAVEMMSQFRSEGLIRAIGIRGPHRYAPERLGGRRADRPDKIQRFIRVLEAVEPEILAVRDNLLTPTERTAGILELAARIDCGVLFNKPLGQGLLTRAQLVNPLRTFGSGDHRTRKRWFTAGAADVIRPALRQLQEVVGHDPAAIVRIALWSCLSRYEQSAVLVGFTTVAQVEENLAAVSPRPTSEQIYHARRIMSDVQERLDADGQVFVDETAGIR